METIRKPRIYLAAPYPRKEEIKVYRDELVALGFEVTSNWLEEKHAANVALHEVSEVLSERYAESDLLDVDRADVVISFTEAPGTQYSRGGRHVEFGYALARGKEVWIVGPVENIFHYLVPKTQVYPSWVALLAAAHNIKQGWFA
jgi:nucleoside 2-deoxyribosyltransferase